MSRVFSTSVGAFTLASGLAAAEPAVQPARPGAARGGMEGPAWRAAAVRPGPGRAFQAGFRDRHRGLPRRDPTIADQSVPPDFDNTIAALERSGRALDRVQAVYGVWSSTMSTPEFRAVEQEIEPKLAALRDESLPEREALPAHRGRLPIAGQGQADARAAAPGLAVTTRISCGRGRSSTPPARRASPPSTSAWPRSTRPSARICSPTRKATPR